MRINLSVIWHNTPVKGRIVVDEGTLFHAGLHCGWGEVDKKTNSFRVDPGDGRVQITMVVDADCDSVATLATRVRVVDPDNPLEFHLRDVLEEEDGELEIPGSSAMVRAEIDAWAEL